MPMASQDPLPKAVDFLSQCEKCHKLVGDLWLVEGEYICDKCYQDWKPPAITNYTRIELDYTETDIKWKGIRGWTRWYGANNTLFTLTPEWYCQACQDKQTKELPSYLIRIQDSEYARICSICLNIALQQKINNIFDLSKVVRKEIDDF